jgi:hypothetical protein
MSVLRPTLKMIAVSIIHQGKTYQKFLLLRYEDGKAVLSFERLQKLKKEFKIPAQDCISIG